MTDQHQQTVADQPMDFREYVARQQRQAHMAQQVEGLFDREEDHSAATVQGIEDSAYRAATEAAAAYDGVQESLTDVITQARDLRQRVQSGLVSDKDARRALADLRKRQAELLAQANSTKTVYEAAKRDIEDPKAKRDQLIDKYPALRR